MRQILNFFWAPLPLFAGSEALFNTFSIRSCLEAIDKYVPLCSKYGNSEYKQKIEDYFEADVASAEPSPNAGSRQPGPAEGELPAFNCNILIPGGVWLELKVRNLILTSVLIGISWES